MNLEEAIAAENQFITIAKAREFYPSCVPGWGIIAQTYNLDLTEAVRTGIRASILFSKNDALINQLLRRVYGLPEEV